MIRMSDIFLTRHNFMIGVPVLHRSCVSITINAHRELVLGLVETKKVPKFFTASSSQLDI